VIAARAPLTASADARREMPGAAAARLDRIEAALATLGDEQRRLQRLGLELPLVRCHQERRYWTFLRALFSIPASPEPSDSEGPEWPAAPSR